MKLPNLIHGANSTIVPSMNFLVIFGPTIISCQSVSELNDVKDYRYINEGGRNDYPIMLKEPKRNPQRLVFKKAIVNKNAVNGLGIGVDTITKLFMSIKGMPGMIAVMDSDRTINALYAFQSMGVIEWSLSDLDAERSAYLIESFTIAHKGLKNIPVIL